MGILNKSFLTNCDLSLQDSDGEKSDDNLVVDVSNEVYTMVFFYLTEMLVRASSVVSMHIGFMNRIMAFAFVKELEMPEGVWSYPLSLECKSDLKHLLLQSTSCFSCEQKVLLRYLKPAQRSRGGAACKAVCLFFHFGHDFMCEPYQICQMQIF